MSWAGSFLHSYSWLAKFCYRVRDDKDSADMLSRIEDLSHPKSASQQYRELDMGY